MEYYHSSYSNRLTGTGISIGVQQQVYNSSLKRKAEEVIEDAPDTKEAKVESGEEKGQETVETKQQEPAQGQGTEGGQTTDSHQERNGEAQEERKLESSDGTEQQHSDPKLAPEQVDTSVKLRVENRETGTDSGTLPADHKGATESSDGHSTASTEHKEQPGTGRDGSDQPKPDANAGDQPN